MRSKYDEKLKAGAAPYLEPGEEVLAALIAQPKGRSQAAVAGPGAAGALGRDQLRQSRAAAFDAGLVVAGPMGLAVTQRRIMTLAISTPVLGRGGEVKELLSAVPLAEVENVRVKRFGLGKRITVTVRGVAVELEAAAGADEFLAAFDRVRASG